MKGYCTENRARKNLTLQARLAAVFYAFTALLSRHELDASCFPSAIRRHTLVAERVPTNVSLHQCRLLLVLVHNLVLDLVHDGLPSVITDRRGHCGT